MTRLIRLYPRAWRARYGDELLDLAQARPLGLAGAVDLIRGALDAHRHPELVDPTVAGPIGSEPVTPQRYADLRVARRLGIACGIGSVAWIAAWVIALNGPMVGVGRDAYRDGAAAMPVLFGAMVLLSAGLVGQMIRLQPGARLAKIAALVASLAAPIFGLGPWNLIFGLLVLAGLVLLAIDAWWRAAWSGTAALVMAGSIGLGLAAVLGALSGLGPSGWSDGAMLIAVVAFTGIWLVTAATLQSLPAVVGGAPPSEVDGVEIVELVDGAEVANA